MRRRGQEAGILVNVGDHQRRLGLERGEFRGGAGIVGAGLLGQGDQFGSIVQGAIDQARNLLLVRRRGVGPGRLGGKLVGIAHRYLDDHILQR